MRFSDTVVKIFGRMPGTYIKPSINYSCYFDAFAIVIKT
jgi:hypothetical protein